MRWLLSSSKYESGRLPWASATVPFGWAAPGVERGNAITAFHCFIFQTTAIFGPSIPSLWTIDFCLLQLLLLCWFTDLAFLREQPLTSSVIFFHRTSVRLLLKQVEKMVIYNTDMTVRVDSPRNIKEDESRMPYHFESQGCSCHLVVIVIIFSLLPCPCSCWCLQQTRMCLPKARQCRLKYVVVDSETCEYSNYNA